MLACCVWLDLLQARLNDARKGCLKETVQGLIFSGASLLDVHLDVATH